MKKLIFVMAVLWGGGAAALWYWGDLRAEPVRFRTVAVERTTIGSTIDATGTIEPVEVVDVGAQVAGRIDRFGTEPGNPDAAINYGSEVEEGTMLAQLDAALYRAKLDQAEAALTRARADVQQANAKLDQARRDLERTRDLRSRGNSVVSAQEYDAAISDVEVAEAAVAVAEGGLAVAEADRQEARVNMDYTTIRSPVHGVVIDRRVNIGQTVVASLNAPSLFLLAKDLSRMEIWASVNETDIGAIEPGQPATFTVGAFPGEEFTGTVKQIRLNASMVHNVVTYTVVVDVDNTEGRLLPYLTARLRFAVEERADVLTVPNAALRWEPDAALIVPESRGAADDAADDDDRGTLWVARGTFVRPVPVRIGLTDGVRTEVVPVEGGAIAEGTEVVVGIAPRDETAGASPFLPEFD